MPVRVATGQLDGILVGIGAAQGEHEARDVTGGDLGEQLA